MHCLGIEEGSSVWLADDLEPHVANVSKVANQFLWNELVSRLEEVALLYLLAVHRQYPRQASKLQRRPKPCERQKVVKCFAHDIVLRDELLHVSKLAWSSPGFPSPGLCEVSGELIMTKVPKYISIAEAARIGVLRAYVKHCICGKALIVVSAERSSLVGNSLEL